MDQIMIANYAEYLYSKKCPNGGEFPIDDFIREAGGSVIVGVSGVPGQNLVIDEPGKFRIFVPPFCGPMNMRYSLAHKLGHYLLHYWPSRKTNPYAAFDCNTLTSNAHAIEMEANEFAVDLLAPPSVCRKKFLEAKDPIYKMAYYFNIPVRVSDVQYNRINTGLFAVR